MQTHIGTLGIVLFLFIGNIYAQSSALHDNYMHYDSQYGLDQMLYNGKKYTPQHTLVKGHPFLYYDQFIDGKVVLKGNAFEPVQLKYDINQQNFVLSYSDRNKANQQLVIPNLLIDSIWISHALFLNANQFNLPEGFVQVLENDDLKLLYRWNKDYQFVATKNDIPHIYSDAKRTTYLYRNGVAEKYRSKGSFVKLFSPEIQKQIKTYMKQQKISLKKASDSDMIGLLIYINNLK